ncbi:ZZ-type zinc finger-containing protein 3 [Mortierella claussenii]|nr:ZZ-type zinc finger-containing protein 3 [Mortierella claussenii]
MSFAKPEEELAAVAMAMDVTSAPTPAPESTHAVDTETIVAAVDPSSAPTSATAVALPLVAPAMEISPSTEVHAPAHESASVAAIASFAPLLHSQPQEQATTSNGNETSVASNGNSNASATTTSTRAAGKPYTSTSALDRGPLGLTADEEQWVRDRMEYALYDFEALALAIKRYKWQLSQVPKDISRLQSLKEKHIEDPFEFLRQVKSKEFRYPEGQRTLPAPSIEWTKYQYPPANPIIPTKTSRATYLPQHHQHYAGQDRIETNTGIEEKDFASQESSQPDRGFSPSPGLMEGVSYSGSGRGVSHIAYRSESAPATSPVSYRAIQPHPAISEHQKSFRQPPPLPAVPSSEAAPANQTIDHTLAINNIYRPLQPQDLVVNSNSNITYNHMSGSVDVQPGNATVSAKPRGASREGSSGARDEPPKPPLYNIPWSDEEQQLLEKLLQVYPDEPVAAQRFQKISAAMGTRTPKQVASRVQKYFIKLVKAGLETPGRMNFSLEPKSKPKPSAGSGAGAGSAVKGKKRKEGPGEGAASRSKPARPRKKETSVEDSVISGSGPGLATGFALGTTSAPKKKKKPKSLLGSGFGRTSGTQYMNYSTAPTVYMSEEDDDEDIQDMLAASSNSNGMHGNGSRRASLDRGIASHLGYSCDSCGVEPILGIRYSCMDCEELGGTDLCGPCYNSGQYQNKLHLLSHRFQAIDTAEMPAYSHGYRSSSAGASGSNGIYQQV